MTQSHKSDTKVLLSNMFEQVEKELDLPFDLPFCDVPTGEYMAHVHLRMPVGITPAELFNTTLDNVGELLKKKVRKGLTAGLKRIVETLEKIEE